MIKKGNIVTYFNFKEFNLMTSKKTLFLSIKIFYKELSLEMFCL